MIAAARRAYDRFTGRREWAVTVPPMDGALRPNRALDAAALVLAVDAPDNLVGEDGAVAFSSGSAVRWLDGRAGIAFDSPVSCLAAGPGGLLAVGTEDGRVTLVDAQGGRSAVALPAGRACPTALAFAGADLLICQGSTRRPPRAWKHDLMELGATGSVWRVPPGGAARCLADGLGWACGMLLDGAAVIVSEAWRHRLVRIGLEGDAAPVAVLEDLPGYPARLCPAAAGGAWLAVFAPRSQLIEFVLREPGYRTRMMAEVPPEYWVAPALASNRSFLEPLQGGGVKQMGILKPWAPCRSYGLVIRLDAGFHPLASMHSRADGVRHGVTSVLEVGGQVLATSRGGDAILSMPADAGGVP